MKSLKKILFISISLAFSFPAANAHADVQITKYQNEPVLNQPVKTKQKRSSYKKKHIRRSQYQKKHKRSERPRSTHRRPYQRR